MQKRKNSGNRFMGEVKKKKKRLTGGNIDRKNARWQRREAGEAEMAAEAEGGGWGGWGRELPAADGSQSQWGMEGDPAVTLKQQVEAIIRSGMADWMSAHTLISSRPSGPPESARMCSFSEEPRHGFKLFSSSLPPPLASHWIPFISQSSVAQ